MDIEDIEDECELCKIDFADYPNAPLDDTNDRKYSGLTSEE